MLACCLCNETFCKRKDGKVYQKHPLSTPIRCKQSLSIPEALKLPYNYNRPINSFICFKCFVAVEKKCREDHGSSRQRTRVGHHVECWYSRAFHNLRHEQPSVYWSSSKCLVTYSSLVLQHLHC